MDAAAETAQLLKWLQDDGYEVGCCCVVSHGVFFSSKQFAKAFAHTHKMELVPVEGPVAGWLAKNPPNREPAGSD